MFVFKISDLQSNFKTKAVVWSYGFLCYHSFIAKYYDVLKYFIKK